MRENLPSPARSSPPALARGAIPIPRSCCITRWISSCPAPSGLWQICCKRPDMRPPIGVAWLLSDMVLVTIMTVLVKLGGATYPAVQMVFIRSLIGLVTVLPLAWHHRHALRQTRQWGRHGFRVLCNTLALNANFAALTALPLALVNAIGFMRPLVVLALATWLLGERSGPWRWIG